MRRTGLRRAVAGPFCALAAALWVSLPAPAVAGDAEVVAPTADFSRPEAFEALPAGALTSRKRPNGDAFSNSSANMSFERELDFKIGNGFFKRLWVSAPSSTTSADGLGPLFNARSCQRCHLKDGRGHPPSANWPADNAVSMFLRLSIPPQSDADRAQLDSLRTTVIPEPTYGTQLQDTAIQGHKPEGRMHIDYGTRTVTLAGGDTVTLRVPRYRVTDLGYGPLHPDTMLSPRVASQMIGMGLLEAIDAHDIEALADPGDRDGDGISGRVNRVWSGAKGRTMIGRFGWKAGNATIADQSAGAFSGDIGISTALFPDGAGECTERQKTCRNAPHGNSADGGPEANEDVMKRVVFYSRNLAVPARRNLEDPEVLAGKRTFYALGCAGCHRPKLITPRNLAELPEQSRQLIWPYTDLLLHDMGDGLADNRPEGLATGREWRTPPLWGIGLTETVSGHTFFLHDGRARNLTEAILWHGGEAQKSRDGFRELPAAERRAVLAFLNSL